MKLMFNKAFGFHQMLDIYVDQATKDGWVDGEPILAAKRGVAPEPITATMDAPAAPRRGRPPKGIFGKE